jgi:epsilon-lactone hydrolase
MSKRPRTAIGVRVPPAVVRLGARQVGRRVLNPDLPWQVQRQRLDRLMAGSPVPRGTKIISNVINGVRTEVVSAAGVAPERTVVHFHGGGYCVGSARIARTWAARLSAQAACRVVLPEYRLAPEHPCPAALEDARDVMKGLVSDVAPGSIVLSGDSAGGGLALSLALALRDEDQQLPAGCILVSPWLDLGRDRAAEPELVRRDVLLSPRWLEACAIAYADPPSWSDPSVSPLLAEPGGLPPLLIQAATDDLLAPDAEGLAARASAAGVDVTYTRWPRMWHNFALQASLLAAADSALAQAAWFVERAT